mmetsp:Transcript_51330/g.160269  ORF Transcript_51330/g.160269 Transcript_51330/m.160269 type:complete len:305 (-) Transcript_51330:870-1784(-)
MREVHGRRHRSLQSLLQSCLSAVEPSPRSPPHIRLQVELVDSSPQRMHPPYSHWAAGWKEASRHVLYVYPRPRLLLLFLVVVGGDANRNSKELEERSCCLAQEKVCEENDEDDARDEKPSVRRLKSERESKRDGPAQATEPDHEHAFEADPLPPLVSLEDVDDDGKGNDVDGSRHEAHEEGPEEETPLYHSYFLHPFRPGAGSVDEREDGVAEVEECQHLRQVRQRPSHVMSRVLTVLAYVVLGIVRHDDTREENCHETGETNRISGNEGEISHGEHHRHLSGSSSFDEHPLGDETSAQARDSA